MWSMPSQKFLVLIQWGIVQQLLEKIKEQTIWVPDLTFFALRGEFYQEESGAAMGSLLLPAVENIFMESFETIALEAS